MYLQIDDVTMGSSLRPTFASLYMGHLESSVFNNMDLKPRIYARYIDEIFVQLTNEEQVIKLKSYLERQSVLNFTKKN